MESNEASAASPAQSPTLDAQALVDISATSYAEAVVLTDGKGRILYSELRRTTPERLGVLLELMLASQSAAGLRFGLGGLKVAASLHESGAIVCGRTNEHSLIILASQRANLGQLLHHVRRVFPQRDLL